jgi:hypothetical protein
MSGNVKGDDDFTCTIRYAGLRLWWGRFPCASAEGILAKLKASDPDRSFRWADDQAGGEINER